MEELELVKACQAGDQKANELLYRRYSAKMFGVCLRYEPCREKAADILQDAFIKVFRSINAFKGEGSFEGWIRKIVVRTALDEFRKTTRLFSVSDYDNYDLPDASPGAVSKLTHGELMDMVQSLSPGYRTVFNLFAIEGYQHKEIAEMLGISEGTSKSQFARARTTLQRLVLAQNPAYQHELASSAS